MTNYQQAERGVLLDMGRKFWPKAKILALLKMMEQNDFNMLQLHFSDNLGFRIESKQFPQIVSEEYLTQKEVKEIIAAATEKGIEIVPDFDTPGHLNQVLKDFPNLGLKKKTTAGLEPDIWALDITNEVAIAFAFTIYQEYLSLFSKSRYFHIGADEFIDFSQVDLYPQLAETAKARYGEEASGLEIYVDYVNRLAALIKEHGKTARIWNDGFYRLDRHSLIELTDDVEVTYWTLWHQGMAPLETWLKKGYQVLNFNDNYFYFVFGEAANYTYPTAEKIQTNWQIETFASDQVIDESDKKQVLGTYFSIWADIPSALSCDEVLAKVEPILAAMQQKLKADS
ncbi:family 20 glycosylhydrolase [Enterococcus sp. HY326]|uniref:family 20 glycosylhydrolase n=1 Tax=Enterococcus sp. HY326 TaxID=2971265 RepID=UPI00223EFE0E|nr:family 20 glycosylhydrolase [Enterococcus sp. HY326]